jgi:hypothetical protein
MALTSGTQLGSYTVTSHSGSGGRGEVYKSGKIAAKWRNAGESKHGNDRTHGLN